MHVISETDCADVVYQKLSKLLLALSKLLLAKLGAFFVPFSIFDTRLPFQKNYWNDVLLSHSESVERF